MPLAVCATPIGNLEDVTLRVLRELAEADARALRGHAAHQGPARPARDLGEAASYHRHNEAKRTAELLPRLVAGERIALVSDAGPPRCERSGRTLDHGSARGGSPGHRSAGALCRRDGTRRERAHGRALPVRRLPAARRRRRSARSGPSSPRWPHPVVAFESPQRLPATLRSLAAALPERPVAVCRELTKRFEEVVRGTAAELAQRFPEPPKGEITLVLGGAPAERPASRSEAATPAAPSGAGRGRRAPPPGRRRRRAAGAHFP